METFLQLLASVLVLGILFKLVAAIAVGALARFLLPGKDQVGWVMTILVGMAGGTLYDLIGRMTGLLAPGTGGGLFGAIIGAMVLLGALRLWKRARTDPGKPGAGPSAPPRS